MKNLSNYHYVAEWEAAIDANITFTNMHFVTGKQQPGHLLVEFASGIVTFYEEQRVADQVLPRPNTQRVRWDHKGHAYSKKKRVSQFDIIFRPQHD